jgi:type I restriction enzyme, S subunit
MSLTISPARIVEESRSPLLAAPDSWPRRPLGEVATILNGYAFKSKQFVPSGGTPLIRIRDIFNEDTAVGYVGEYDERYVVRPDELLVGMDGDFNAARWRGPTGLLNQRVCKITPDATQLDLDFLTHILPGYLQAIHDLTSSTTVTHLSSRDVAQIPIPVPPLAEQQVLAHLFGLAATKQQSSGAHARTASRAIERFRHAVLAAACAGRLTADWRDGTRGSVSANLKSTVESRIADRMGVPPSWVIVRVADIGTVQLGGTPSRKRSEYWNGEVHWVSSGEVANCRISATRETITELGLSNSSAKLYPAGTVLIAMIGEGKTRGQAAILDIEAATNQNAAGILADPRFVEPEYLWRWALAEYETTRAVGRGGNQPALNKEKVGDLVLPLPPLAEQAEIVRRVDQLLTRADELQVRVESATRKVERSSHAILAKAFRGELVGSTE